MSCARNDRDFERASGGEEFLRCRWDRCDFWISCRETIAATEWNITLTGDDQDRTSKIVDRPDYTVQGQHLADGDWLTGGKSKGENLGVKIPRRKEVGLETARVTRVDVAVGVMS